MQIIKDNLEGFNGSACLVEHKGNYYVVSTIECAFDTGKPETLAFRSDEYGNVKNWGEIAGGRFMTREETIKEIENLQNE